MYIKYRNTYAIFKQHTSFFYVHSLKYFILYFIYSNLYRYLACSFLKFQWYKICITVVVFLLKSLNIFFFSILYYTRCYIHNTITWAPYPFYFHKIEYYYKCNRYIATKIYNAPVYWYAAYIINVLYYLRV